MRSGTPEDPLAGIGPYGPPIWSVWIQHHLFGTVTSTRIVRPPFLLKRNFEIKPRQIAPSPSSGGRLLHILVCRHGWLAWRQAPVT